MYVLVSSHHGVGSDMIMLLLKNFIIIIAAIVIVVVMISRLIIHRRSMRLFFNVIYAGFLSLNLALEFLLMHMFHIQVSNFMVCSLYISSLILH